MTFETPIFFPTLATKSSCKIFRFKKNPEIVLADFPKIKPFSNGFLGTTVGFRTIITEGGLSVISQHYKTNFLIILRRVFLVSPSFFIRILKLPYFFRLWCQKINSKQIFRFLKNAEVFFNGFLEIEAIFELVFRENGCLRGFYLSKKQQSTKNTFWGGLIFRVFWLESRNASISLRARKTKKTRLQNVGFLGRM